MRAIASYILKGPVQAVMSASVPAMLSVSAPFVLKLLLIYFSGIAIALVALRFGPRHSLMVLLMALVSSVAAGLALSMDSDGMLDLWNSVYLWVLIWISAIVLRSAESLARMLEVIAVISVTTLLVFYSIVDDPISLGLKLLEPVQFLATESVPDAPKIDMEKLRLDAAGFLPGSMMTYTVLGAMFCLFMARSWQASLFNPAGFRQEFLSLRYSRSMGVTSLLLIAMLLFSSSFGEHAQLVVINISLVIGLLYIVGGLAVAHGLIAVQKKSPMLLVGLYVMLAIMTKVFVPLLMVLSLSDIWLDFRTRWFSGR